MEIIGKNVGAGVGEGKEPGGKDWEIFSALDISVTLRVTRYLKAK